MLEHTQTNTPKEKKILKKERMRAPETNSEQLPLNARSIQLRANCKTEDRMCFDKLLSKMKCTVFSFITAQSTGGGLKPIK